MNERKGRMVEIGSAAAAIEAQFKKLSAHWIEPDPARIETSMARFEAEAGRALRSGVGEALIAEVLPLLGEIKPDKFVASFGPRTRSRRTKQLLVHLRDLDMQFPMATGLLLHPVVGDRRFVQALRQGCAYLKIASRRRREYRSEALRQALHVIIEVPYYAYVEVLYRGECLKRNKPMAAPRGGQQLKKVAQWVPPELVVADANQYRNAAAHASWKYIPSADVIELAHGSRREVVSNRDMYRLGIRLLEDVVGLYDALSLTAEGYVRLLVEAGALEAIKYKDSTLFDEAALLRAPAHSTYQSLQRLGMALA